MEVMMDGVSKTIKGITVIDHVSLRFCSGRVTGLRGVNGSGKTMLMRLAAGLIRPTEGTIKIGEEILWKELAFPRSVGLLIENPAFLDFYSGFENLKMIASVRGVVGPDQIAACIREVGLDPLDKKKYKKYSLGMKQRLGIAAAIMEAPEIILLDEPTNALDSAGIELLKQLLKREKERGAAVLLSCHDFSILRELSDEIYSIEEGRITGLTQIEEATETP